MVLPAPSWQKAEKQLGSALPKPTFTFDCDRFFQEVWGGRVDSNISLQGDTEETVLLGMGTPSTTPKKDRACGAEPLFALPSTAPA